MKELITAASGRADADTVFRNGKIVNVYNGCVEESEVAVKNGVIVGVGEGYRGVETVDLNGAYLVPGLIDAHLHIESTMLSPAHFAAAVLPWGTTTGICDPHEIANVCGAQGVRYMAKEAATTPFDARFMCPSCVPATPFEDNGATLGASDIEELSDVCSGVGELMNAPGVVNCSPDVLDKLAVARKHGYVVDGHFPKAAEKALNAYLCAGVSTDHECTDAEDAKRKLARGMYVLMREGSATKNVRALAEIVNAHTVRRIAFCTDDRQVEDLQKHGHLNYNLALAVECGVAPVDAVIMATLTPAECYRLYDRGAIAPGKIADLTVFEDLKNFRPLKVYKNGVLCAENGKALFEAITLDAPEIRSSVHMAKISEENLAIHIPGGIARVIALEPHNVTTKEVVRAIETKDGAFDYREKGIAKLCVAERHKNTGKIGLGLLEGYGIEGGAVALSVAHDSHNIIACGDNDRDILCAIEEIRRVGGGVTAVRAGAVYETLELPIAGLMSDRGAGYIGEKTKKLNRFAHEQLKVAETAEPFMTLSFLSLVVIPELKLSTRGLFDYDTFSFVPVEVKEM